MGMPSRRAWSTATAWMARWNTTYMWQARPRDCAWSSTTKITAGRSACSFAASAEPEDDFAGEAWNDHRPGRRFTTTDHGDKEIHKGIPFRLRGVGPCPEASGRLWEVRTGR